MERTYVMIKPDGVQRGLVGRIIKRFESAGLQLVGLKMCIPTEEMLSEHYSELSQRPFFSCLLAYVGSGPVVCMVWKGAKAVERARNLIGKTDPANATSGTIRADMAAIPGRNVIHGADSVESAEKEISIWFGSEDGNLAEWELTIMPWIDDGTTDNQGEKKESSCPCESCTCDPCTCEAKKKCSCEPCTCDPCTCEQGGNEDTIEEENEEAEAADE